MADLNAAPEGPTVFGEPIGYFYGAPGEVEALQEALRAAAVSSGTLFPWDAETYNFNGVYAVSITSDPEGRLTFAFRGESPLNPAVN